MMRLIILVVIIVLLVIAVLWSLKDSVNRNDTCNRAKEADSSTSSDIEGMISILKARITKAESEVTNHVSGAESTLAYYKNELTRVQELSKQVK